MRRDCEAKLFSAIAHGHGVGLADVAQARERLSAWRPDPIVHVPVAAFCVAAMAAVARRIRRRFPRDEKAAAIGATLFASVMLGVVVVSVGEIWGAVVEMMRVGDTHMSYRAARIGWRGHGAEVFALAALLFWFVVIVHYRAASAMGSRKVKSPGVAL